MVANIDTADGSNLKNPNATNACAISNNVHTTNVHTNVNNNNNNNNSHSHSSNSHNELNGAVLSAANEIGISSNMQDIQTVTKSKHVQYLQRSLSDTAREEASTMSMNNDALTTLYNRSTCLSAAASHSSSLLSADAECGLSFLLRSGLGRPPPAMSRLHTQTKRNLTLNYKVIWDSCGHMHYPAYCVVFDQTGRYALTGADDYLVKLWDVEGGHLVYTCRGHVGEISIIVISPDNALFASACTLGE